MMRSRDREVRRRWRGEGEMGKEKDRKMWGKNEKRDARKKKRNRRG